MKEKILKIIDYMIDQETNKSFGKLYPSMHDHKKEVLIKLRKKVSQMQLPVGVPKPNHTCENLVTKQDEYIKLLGEEINELAGMATIHGWHSSRANAGIKLREEIKQLKSKFEQREA